MLYPLQFSFCEKYSTIHALLSLTESIKLSIDNGKFGCGIFLDLQKAFDTVNHKILPGKLEHYGARGNVSKWFNSYLTELHQYVVVNGHVSDFLPITCGVPQGSRAFDLFDLHKWFTICFQSTSVLSVCWWCKYLLWCKWSNHFTKNHKQGTE